MKFIRPQRATVAFSLIEIMVAVSLLVVIMIGLLAMFYQTQRAFRLASTQVDVIETGRATMQMLTSELKQMVPSPEPFIPGLHTATVYPMLPLWRPDPVEPMEAYLKELFFVTRENDQWVAYGYFVDPVTPFGGAGSLYQFSTNIPIAISNAVELAFKEFKIAKTDTQPRVADRVIHFNLYAYDRYGFPFLGNGPGTNKGELDFRTNLMPAYV